MLKGLASRFAHRRADALHEQGIARSDAGDDDAALALYHRALELESARPVTLYNIGLIHKYRGAWRESLDYNRRAFELRPDDEATCWNLGIAATALGDWKTARAAWAAAGIEVEPGEGPILDDFGMSCVRLNPDEAGEVVWVRRLDPVRARILNVPLASSGFFYGDLVLHDGAATGSKLWDGKEYAIFNAFERLERSPYGTATVDLVAPSREDVLRLAEMGDAEKLATEDWTTVSFLCRACSEGVTHVGEHDPVWNPDRNVGIGVHDEDALHRVLEGWATSGPGRGATIRDLVR